MPDKRFLLGCMTGIALAVALNLAPDVWTRYNNVADDFEVVGFPLSFSLAGGIAGVSRFILSALLVDLASAIVMALLLGWAATKLPRNRRGFPLDSH